METHRVDEPWGPKGLRPEAYGFPTDPQEARNVEFLDAGEDPVEVIPPPQGTWETSHGRERSAMPLTVKRAGSLFEVAWRNAEGDPYVTQSRSILEVRVSLSLSCADSETSNKLAEDWESFKLANTDFPRRQEAPSEKCTWSGVICLIQSC